LSLPIFIEECPELEGVTAVQVFSNYQHLPWAMLLDTCNNQLSDGRYDIIVHSPIAKLVVKNKQLIETAIKGWTNLLKIKSDRVNHCPFERLEAIHTQFKEMVTVPEASPLPFLCGALGYFNYDLNIQLDGIQDNKTEQYSSPDLAVGIYDQSLIFDNKTNKVYCCYLDAGRAEQLKKINPNKDKLDSHSHSIKPLACQSNRVGIPPKTAKS
jgi:para-aminobenzoate synthetase component 1